MISERRIAVNGVETRLLEQEGSQPEHPVLLVHGNPTHAGDWRPFMEAFDGRRRCLAPDLPGWGFSDREAPFPHTMDALATWLEGLLDSLAVQRFDLLVHDWGSLGLITAQRRAQATGRLVIINGIPLLPGYRWHWVARLWRRRGIGWLVNATTTRFAVLQLLRQATPRKGSLPEIADLTMEGWDRGMWRAMLELYRDADPDNLEAAGTNLGKLTGPSLIIWGDDDLYVPSRFADLYAEALGGQTTVEHISPAGHWPWLDQPELIGRVVEFLSPEPAR